MVLTLRELSEDERIRLQCQAREGYERRLSGMFEHGEKIGLERGEKIGLERGEQLGIEKGKQLIITLISELAAGTSDAQLLAMGYSEKNILEAREVVNSVR